MVRPDDPARPPAGLLHGLNDNHRRHLVSSVQHALKLLRDCSDALAAGEAATGPARYRRPLVEPVRSEIQEGLVQLQTRLVAVLEDLGLALPAPTLDAAAAVRVGLLALDITCEEMAGRHLRGYGTLPPETERALDLMAGQLRDLVRSVTALLPTAGATDDSGTRAAEDAATRPAAPPAPGPSPRATGNGDDRDPGDDTGE